MPSRRDPSAICQIQTLIDLGAAGDLSDGELLDRFLNGSRRIAEGAFEVLLGRHGPMVLGVCRGILKDPHLAEDAYQATFLILASKASAVRLRDSLGTWLYGVARRVAVRAKSNALARVEHERRVAETSQPWASPFDLDQSEDLAVLREEIDRLPSRYRDPVVLCYLEEMTYERASRSLRVTEATVRGRLARARELLRTRLHRRGSADPLAVPALLAALPATPIAPSLMQTTARFATELATGPTSTGAASASVIILMKGVLRTMILAKMMKSAAILLALIGLGFGAKAVAFPRLATPPLQKSAKVAEEQKPAAVKVEPGLAKLIKGRVVRASDLRKDNMVLMYLPEWNHGNVDNIGVANNHGGVRTLVDWPSISPDEANAPERRFLLAIYSRKTTSNGKPGPILAFEVSDDWTERTSWRTRPEYEPEPAAWYKFEPGDGWKLFDITPLVQARARENREGHGIVLRFLNEDHQQPNGWSGYEFVSREATGEWLTRQPTLLVVDPTRN